MNGLKELLMLTKLIMDIVDFMARIWNDTEICLEKLFDIIFVIIQFIVSI